MPMDEYKHLFEVRKSIKRISFTNEVVYYKPYVTYDGQDELINLIRLHVNGGFGNMIRV